MKIPSELEGSRLNVTRAAALISMDPGHFRRMVRRGVFPAPKRTSKGLPFFDFELLSQIGGVIKSGIGLSGEEISFYRRKPKQTRQRLRTSRRAAPQASDTDDYFASIIEGCRQLGVADALLTASKIKSILASEFGTDRPELERALPVVARRIFAGE